MNDERQKKFREFKDFIKGGPKCRTFLTLDPSSYAAVLAGKPGGSPTIEDEIAFHQAFPNDAVIHVLPDYERCLPELRWARKRVKEGNDGSVFWEETLRLPSGTKRRIVADKPGGIPWLVEPAVKSVDDFVLIDFFADRILESAPLLADKYSEYPLKLQELGMLPGMVLLSAFEVYWLIDYPDMPLFFLDWPERYLRTIEKVHTANLALLEAMSKVGYELFFTGSAGLELLNPQIFIQAIVPFQRPFNDQARRLGRSSSYHICGHSRQLIEQGIIDQIRPTIFETCSSPPCGNNPSLGDAIANIDAGIITKGNLSLEALLNWTPEQIIQETKCILNVTKNRRHIVGQADATILTGTPYENIQAFVETALQF